jgi:hypothetical protein
MQPIAMGANTWGQPEPQWEFQNDGKEISQRVNSAPGIAIGAAKLAGVDFEGTFFVGEHEVRSVYSYTLFFFFNYLLALKGGPTFLGFFLYTTTIYTVKLLDSKIIGKKIVIPSIFDLRYTGRPFSIGSRPVRRCSRPYRPNRGHLCRRLL